MKELLTILFILFVASKNYGQVVSHKDESKAITTIVFIDHADQGEYMAGVVVKNGSFSKGDYVKNVDNKGNFHYFLIDEIKVNDQTVEKVLQGQQSFLVLKTTQKARYFDAGQDLLLASKKDYDRLSAEKIHTIDKSALDTQENPYVYFSINGQEALTSGNKTNDTDIASAILNQQNNKLTMMLYGDHKDQARRGMVTIDILNFTPKKGAIKNASFSFVRYKDKSGNMLAEWANSKGNYGILDVTDITSLGKDAYGESFLISGIFEANLPLKMGYESETKIKSMDITKGTFNNVYVQAMFYKK